MLAENIDEDEDHRKDAAVDLVERGFHVLAVKAGEKRPDSLLVPSGFLDATTDLETVAGWWSVKPKANIGIACGVDYGIVVIDVDVKHGAPGMATYAELELGNYPTLTATTPTGGYHLYFRHPGVRLPPKLPGIDIKGADGGGYVLAPPSTLPEGAYSWRDPEMPVVEFPVELLERLPGVVKPERNTVATDPVAWIKTPEGDRHKRLLELGAAYRGMGLGEHEIKVLLWDHAEHLFDPPFRHDNLQEAKEIEDVVRWFGGKPGAEPKAETVRTHTTAELLELAERAVETPLLDPVLPYGGSMLIYGPTGHGKSHLGLSMALALSRGTPLLGWLPAEPVNVLYVDGEMALGELSARLRQYLAGASPPDNLHWIAAFAQDVDMPDLGDERGQVVYTARVAEVDAKVVVFDNLSCLRIVTAEAGENTVEGFQPIRRFLNELNRRGVATITIHHANKAGGQRGTTAHAAPMDTILKVEEDREPDPMAELDVHVTPEKHRRFSGESAARFRAKVFLDADDYARWELVDHDAMAQQVADMVKQGMSVRQITDALKRSKAGVQKAIRRAKARGLLPLQDVE